ncbi:MAG: InlB B-repeat-containing protein [Clostridia bacterium]|nr:InlB B-repeat-containing protein [Clostridia bacterium]
MKKRVLSIFMCIVMFCSMIPISGLGTMTLAAGYTLTFDKNTTADVANMPTKQSGATSYTILDDTANVPTRFQYTLLGWSESKTAKTPDYIPGDKIELTASTTLYAVWQHYGDADISATAEFSPETTISFHHQQIWYRVKPEVSDNYLFWSVGGYNPDVSLYDADGKLLAYNDNDPNTNELGYYLSYNLVADEVYYMAVSGITIGQTSFVTRPWVYNGSKFTSIIYHNNYPNDTDPTFTQRQYNGISGKVTWKVPTFSGYNFLGWAKDPVDYDILIFPDEILPIGESVHLYAIWEKAYEIATGSSVWYPGSLEYGTKTELYSFTPEVDGVYEIVLEEHLAHGSFDGDIDGALCKFTIVPSYSAAPLETESSYRDETWYIKADFEKDITYYIFIQNNVEKAVLTDKVFFEDDYFEYKCPSYSLHIVKQSTLKYDANGGENAPMDQTGSDYYMISSALPTRLGYNFCGWDEYPSDDSTNYVGNDLPVDYDNWSRDIHLNTDTTLYATWSKAPEFTANCSFSQDILFNGQTYYFSFTPVETDEYVIYSLGDSDTEVFLLDNAGNELAFDDDSGENKNFLVKYTLKAGNQYFYGIKYVGNTTSGTMDGKFGRIYDVTYDANEGVNPPKAQKKDYDIPLTLTTDIPKKTFKITYDPNGGKVSDISKTVDCTFSNWNTKQAGTGVSYEAGGIYDVNLDNTLYAQWINPTAGELLIPERDGYAFDGWYTALSGGSKVTKDTVINGNITIYARWAPVTYTISLNGNGGIAYPATLSVTAGDSITLPTPVQPKTYTISYNANGGQVAISSNTVDCSFSTWNTKADGSGTNYRTDASYAPNSNTTLFAQWIDPKAGTLPAPTREHFTFAGWYTDPVEGTKITSSSKITKDLTLYAHWNPIIRTVNYNATGGIVDPETITINSGNNTILPEPSKTFIITYDAMGGTVYSSSLKLNCTFKGWTKDIEGETTVFDAYDSYFVAEDTDFYAQWYHPYAGTLSYPVRPGYLFAGWYTSPTGGTRIISTTKIDSSMTIYAHWIKIVAESCTVINLPKSTFYYKEAMNFSGIVLNVRYNDGTVKKVTDTSKMTFTGFDSSTTGTKKITVTYEGVSTSFNITVKYAWWQWLIRILLFGWIWY